MMNSSMREVVVLGDCIFHRLDIDCIFTGWGELPSVQPKSEPAWGEPAAPTSAVDNGTSAWGKPPAGVGGWGDGSHEPSGPYGRANGPQVSAPCKPGKTHTCPIRNHDNAQLSDHCSNSDSLLLYCHSREYIEHQDKSSFMKQEQCK